MQQRLRQNRLNGAQFLLCPAGGGVQAQWGEQRRWKTAAAAAQQVPAPHQSQISDHVHLHLEEEH